jgi:hypothetical protein
MLLITYIYIKDWNAGILRNTETTHTWLFPIKEPEKNKNKQTKKHIWLAAQPQ